MTGDTPQYRMTLSLNVLRHLGLGLYSNIAAVLSEAVANAWDADAKNVSIVINADEGKVIIEDDGHGMTVDDINNKYLTVGYERRQNESHSPTLKRPVMGRKGIGKLSLFSIAQTVELHTVSDNAQHGFIMDSAQIEETIADEHEADYNPEPVDPHNICIRVGTQITLTNMKRKLQWTGKALRKRLARRFSIIGTHHDFNITLNGEPITIEDREYQDKIQYLWTYGDKGRHCHETAKGVENHEERCNKIDDSDYEIDGWIATASKSGQLKDPDTQESLNNLVIMVRGKLAQEDILEDFGEGGLYTKYLFGEIHADFLDIDDQDDIATTSRQRIIEEDTRYKVLKEKLNTELKWIQSKWTDLRNQQGADQAFIFPQIEEWFNELDGDQKAAAKKLFGRINQFPIDDDDQKRPLFISGVLAFESLKLRKLLNRLDQVSIENMGVLKDVFIQLDDLEASAYYQISNDRLQVIEKLESLVDEKAKEKALQEHLYKHLWLLDPSWERATNTQFMERRIHKALQGVTDSLTQEERDARLDISYTTTGTKHVIIELKRADRVLTTSSLFSQIEKYYRVAEKVLENSKRTNEPIEIICVIGRQLSDWESASSKTRSRNVLQATNARVVTYDELIDNALKAYHDYLDRREEAGRVYRLIQEISERDAGAINPTNLDDV